MQLANRSGIDWRPLKWLGKIVLGLMLAAVMALLLQAWAYNSKPRFRTPGMKYAHATVNDGGLESFGRYMDLSLEVDIAICFAFFCCLNYAYKWWGKRL